MTLLQIAKVRDQLKALNHLMLAEYVETVLSNANTKPLQVCEWLRFAATLIEQVDNEDE
jgi:DNA-binding FrmR family transcriptional regulator